MTKVKATVSGGLRCVRQWGRNGLVFYHHRAVAECEEQLVLEEVDESCGRREHLRNKGHDKVIGLIGVENTSVCVVARVR